MENDVHVLGVSSLAAAHLTLVPELKAELAKQGRDDIMIVVGGVVPPQDYDALMQGRRRGDLPARHGDRGSRREAAEVAQQAPRATAKRPRSEEPFISESPDAMTYAHCHFQAASSSSSICRILSDIKQPVVAANSRQVSNAVWPCAKGFAVEPEQVTYRLKWRRRYIVYQVAGMMQHQWIIILVIKLFTKARHYIVLQEEPR